MRVLLPVIVSWLFCLAVCHGYRLLGLFPFQGKSHFVMFEHLMKGLARKGHQIDIVSKFPLKKPYPNYTDIVTLPMPVHLVNNITFEFMQQLLSVNPTYIIATMAGNELCEYLGHPAIKELARPKSPPYDAVLMEVYNGKAKSLLEIYQKSKIHLTKRLFCHTVGTLYMYMRSSLHLFSFQRYFVPVRFLNLCFT